MARYPTSTVALDDSERSWWTEHGEVEERFCWVQTPADQRIVRGRYLEAMVREVAPGDRVLEVGCGTGWLCLLLAERGLRGLVGTDFSPSQLDRARAAARERGLDHAVAFLPPEELEVAGAFDVVVMHAFLHHLSTEEIAAALEGAASRLRPGGKLLVVEPVHHADGPARGPVELSVLRRLALLPAALAKRGLRRQRPAELAARADLGTRAWGAPPFGPSPKETPFAPGELGSLLGRRFAVARTVPVLCYTHLVAQELLVASLSQPRLWAAVRPALLRAASALDRRLVARPEASSTVWVFELSICTLAA